MTPLILHWQHGRFPITVRTAGVSEQRYGLITEDGVWGLHLDGYHVDLTHIPSGNRLWRFRQLGPAAEALRDVLSKVDVQWAVRKPIVDDETTTQIESILKQYDGVAT